MQRLSKRQMPIPTNLSWLPALPGSWMTQNGHLGCEGSGFSHNAKNFNKIERVLIKRRNLRKELGGIQ
jgi:hypothetical protein